MFRYTSSLLLLGISILLPTVLSVERPPQRIWTLHGSSYFGGMSYIAADNTHRGFALEIANAVCEEAGMDCRVVRGNAADCWSTNPGDKPSGGRGLFGGWYDGCLARYPTIERIHAFSFTQHFSVPSPTYIWVLKGNNFNAHDFRGQIVGVTEGTPLDETCIARHDVHYTFTANNTVFLAQIIERLTVLQTGQVNGVFTNEEVWSDEDLKLVEKVPEPVFHCALGGLGVMARKDSHFVANWNVGFNKLKNSPKWAKLCKESTENHAHKGVRKCVD